MTESCCVYKRMANCLGHVLTCVVLLRYPRLVMIVYSVSPVLVISVPFIISLYLLSCVGSLFDVV